MAGSALKTLCFEGGTLILKLDRNIRINLPPSKPMVFNALYGGERIDCCVEVQL